MPADDLDIRLGHGVLCHENSAAVLKGLNGGLEGTNLFRHLHDLLLVKTDQRPIYRKLADLVGGNQRSHGLRRHLADALAGDQAEALVFLSQMLRDTHHITAHDDGQLLMGAFLVDIQLNVRKVDHMKIDGTSVLGYDLRQIHHLLLSTVARVWRCMKIHCIYLYAALCDHIACHGGINTAGQKKHRLTACADGHTAGSGDDLGINIDFLTDLHIQHNVRIMHIHCHLRICI